MKVYIIETVKAETRLGRFDRKSQTYGVMI